MINQVIINKREDFPTIYSKDKDIIDKLSDSFALITKKYNIDHEILNDYIENNIVVEKIPISIFSLSIAPLQAVVLYLRNIGYPIYKIAKALNRDNRTIWTTYNNAKDKKLKITPKDFIPVEILANRKYSILENIAYYLKEKKKYSLKEISVLLNKNNKTIWTVYDRYKKKNS